MPRIIRVCNENSYLGSILIEKSIKEKLFQIALEEKRNVADILREIIEDYVKNYEERDKDGK